MILPYTFVAEHAEKLYDHERDVRPDVERIVLLTNEQLAALRGAGCPDPNCNERPCHADCCDRGCNRHADNMVEVRPLVVRFVCNRCVESVECACGCGKVMPRWQTTTVGGEVFGPTCCGIQPAEAW